MRRSKTVLLCFLLFLLSGAAAASVYLVFFRQPKEKTSLVAHIYQNGREIETVMLSEVSEPYELTIPGEDGAYNILLVEKDRISMKAASCPDHICIQRGAVRQADALPITCLPNHVIVQVTGN